MIQYHTSHRTYKIIPNTDLEAIQSLYRRCFGLKRSISYLRGKYAHSIGYVAYFGNRPVAHYGIFQWPVAGYNSYQSADTMTDPDHRGQGLFIHLAKLTYASAKLLGVDFVFGFPNENSLPGFKKIGWQFFGCMKELQIKTHAIPVAEICYRLNIPYRWHFEYFMGKFAVNNHLLIARLNEWYSAKELISSVRQIAFWLGCHKAVIICSENSPIYQSLPDQDWVDGCPIGYFPLNLEANLSRIIFTFDMIDTWF